MLEMLAMFLIPASLPIAFGHMAKSRKQGWIIFGAMGAMFLVFLATAYINEMHGNPALRSEEHTCELQSPGQSRMPSSA